MQDHRDDPSSGNEDNSPAQNGPGRAPTAVSDSAVQSILSSLLLRSSDRPQLGGESQSTVSIDNISLNALRQLLRGRLVSVTEDDPDEEGDELEEDEENDDDDDYYGSFRRHAHNWFEEVTEPQPAGVELLKSGDFGRIGPKIRSREGNLNIAKTILNRSVRPSTLLHREEYTSNLVPNTDGTTVASYGANIYTAQFSDDSSFYYTCAQDFRLHIFDTTAPRIPVNEAFPYQRYGSSLQTTMHVRKTIQGHPGRWTVTDANLSPDNERMIYSSITPTVYMTSTAPDGSPSQIPISFADRRRNQYDLYDSGNFGIWSCRFSADGNEVVAGGSGKIFVYDLLANRRTVKINAHNDDVNSCCWADTASGNVLISASDDTFIKVWDRRSLGSSQRPSGVLMGHTEGITYVSAKGDGRYIISNGKDQALRLWDLRKMRTSAEYEKGSRRYYGVDNFDYRYPHYPKPKHAAHPMDCSVMTYRGHAVLRTLIRCHFSPAETTGGQYIYSGSADGRIHIWSLDGTVAQVLDRSRTLPASFDASGPEPEATNGHRTNSCVRDVSWHSQEPVLMSAGWENRGGSKIARHEWKGLTKMPGAVEDWVEKTRLEQAELDSERRHSRRVEERRRAGRHLPGSFFDDDDEYIF